MTAEKLNQNFLILAFIAIGWVALAGKAPCQEAGRADRRFSIGFLAEGSDFTNASALAEQLRQAIREDEQTASALARAGYEEIVLSPADGPRDMVQRLNQGEFELALATAVVYARQQGPYEQPILQTRLPGDFQLGGAEGGWLRRGVVFVGPRTPLMNAEPTVEAIQDLIERSPMVVASADSAAGYIYSTLKMRIDYGGLRPDEYWFCGSDSEVVKHVVSGLAPVGACRQGTLEQLIDEDLRDQAYRILFRTDPFPTDPILLRNDLRPERADLGRELKALLRGFFRHHRLAPQLRVEDASVREYEKLTRDLKVFEALHGEQRLPAALEAPAAPVEVDGGEATGADAETSPTETFEPVREMPILPNGWEAGP